MDLYLRLKKAAERHGTSIAAFVRDAAEKALAEQRKTAAADPLDKIVGKGRAKDRDLSTHHDKYLYSWIKDAPSRPKKK